MAQKSLFNITAGPEGFKYEAEFITREEEKLLLEEFKDLRLSNYIHGEYEAKRKIKSYTKKFGYPKFLIPIIARAAKFAGVRADQIEHAMVTEYSPGTQIGWHRDQPPYNQIIGISLGSSAPFRFRKEKGTKWERITVTAEPRSIYIMSGSARYVWQHSIPPVEDWRYSITMRTIEK